MMHASHVDVKILCTLHLKPISCLSGGPMMGYAVVCWTQATMHLGINNLEHLMRIFYGR